MEKEQFTLDYLTKLVNHLSLIGAREEMRKFRGGDVGNILDYLKDDSAKTQLFIEYVYVGNRVGGGVSKSLLDKNTIFQIWTTGWWRELYKILEPLIQQEREKRNNKELYSHFERFVRAWCK